MLIKPNDTVVFAGDSVTDAGRDKTAGPGELNSFEPSYVARISQALITTYPDYANRVINAGVGGNDTNQLKARYDKDVLAYQPNVVFILIGINDVWRWYDRVFQRGQKLIDAKAYAANLEELITRTQNAGATPIIMNPFMFDTNMNDPMRKQLVDYQKAAQAAAEAYKLTFIDTQKAINEFLKVRSCYYLTQDRVHPNDYGNFFLAKTILNAIGFDWKHLPA